MMNLINKFHKTETKTRLFSTVEEMDEILAFGTTKEKVAVRRIYAKLCPHKCKQCDCRATVEKA